MNNGKKLVVIGVALVIFIVILIANAVTENNESSQNIEPDDTSDPTLTVTLSSPLAFNETDGSNSVNFINNTAGTEVCKYENGNLSFTQSVKINLGGIINNDSLLKFNANSDQKITVNGGVKVCIYCDYQYIKMTENNDYAVISCDRSLTFAGSGLLKIELTKSSAVAGTCGWDIVYAKSNVYFDNSEVEFYNNVNVSPGYGVVCSGTDFVFSKSKVICKTSGHTFYCKSTDTNYIELNQCNVKVSAGESAFKFSSKEVSRSAVMVTISGGKDIDQLDTISVTDVESYNNIEVKAETIYGLSGESVLIAVGVIVGIIIVIIIAIKLYKRTKVFKNKSNQEAVYYEPSLLSDDANSSPNGGNDGTPNDPKASSEDSVGITASASVKSRSFVLMIDGSVIGYIISSKSTFDVPKGMHEVRIVTNNMGRIEIYKENILIDGPMEFTVNKKIVGYTVEKS